MIARERILTALQHKEADRVPFDLGSTRVTGITKYAYRKLTEYLEGKSQQKLKFFDVIQQLVEIEEEIHKRLKIDTVGLQPNSYRKDPSHIEQTKTGQTFKDEWGVTWRKPERGLYFDPVQYPLAGDISIEDVDSLPWPNPVATQLLEGLAEQAENAYTSGYAVLMEDFGAGIFEQALRLRGYSQFYMDLVANTPLACRILDKILELKIKYWETTLKKMGKYVQIIRYGDDLGGQDRLLISPKTYREIMKPRHKELFTFLKRNFPDIYIMFHSDGAIYEIIPDLIEIEADILNPVQLCAQGMDAKTLKKEFGDSITFWGGGVDPQRTLPRGTPKEIKEEVKKRIDLLAPGGELSSAPSIIFRRMYPRRTSWPCGIHYKNAECINQGGAVEMLHHPRC